MDYASERPGYPHFNDDGERLSLQDVDGGKVLGRVDHRKLGLAIEGGSGTTPIVLVGPDHAVAMVDVRTRPGDVWLFSASGTFLYIPGPRYP